MRAMKRASRAMQPSAQRLNDKGSDQERAFSRSRISSSRTSDRLGAGGALGASASRRMRRAGALQTQKTTRAIIRNLSSALMKRPILIVGAAAFWAASKVG